MKHGLSHWQNRLHKHFSQLKAERSDKRPIFALEHGLSKDGRDALFEAICSSTLSQIQVARHPLPWIVFATEIGYGFDGQVYWQAFRDELPEWKEQGNRYWIRRQFEHFHSTYRGVKPRGKWADHRSIIAWPITHAIVPLDLQRHLIGSIHALRHTVTITDQSSIERLGRRIRDRAQSDSTVSERYRRFTEQAALVGQVAAALLTPEDEATGFLHSATRERIIQDLENLRLGHLLESARTSVQRTRMRGVRRDTRGRASSRDADDSLKSQSGSTLRRLYPQLLLEASGEQTYDVKIEVPALAPLCEQDDSVSKVVMNKRSEVAGATQPHFWKQYFAHASRIVKLREWPDGDQPLIHFPEAETEVNAVIHAAVSLEAAPVRLFKVHHDGRAYELRTRCARPGGEYILAGSASALPDIEAGTTVAIQCEDAEGIRFKVPPAPDATWKELLSQVNVNLVHTIDVWPAGIVPAHWDGEGAVSWMETDTPCIGIRSDQPVKHFRVCLDGDATIEIKPSEIGSPVFVQLPALPVGDHEVTVHVEGDKSLDTGHLHITIDEPVEWESGNSGLWPLNVYVDPPAPSMEQMWNGKVDVHIDGPPQQSVRLQMALYDGEERTPLAQIELDEALPIQPSAWRDLLVQRVRDNENFKQQYDYAQVYVIDIDGQQLGSYSLRCDRRQTALRWLTQRKDGKPAVVLVDDSGSEEETQVVYYEPNEPHRASRQTQVDPVQEYPRPKTGVLYHAQGGDLSDTLLVSPEVQRIGRDSDLANLVPLKISLEPNATALEEALLASAHWHRPYTPNPFGQYLQERAIKAISAGIAQAMCGEEWCSIEDSINQHSKPWWPHFKHLVPSRGAGEHLLKFLERSADKIAREEIKRRRRRLKKIYKQNGWIDQRTIHLGGSFDYEEWMKRGGPHNAAWVAEFSLRLMSAPHTVYDWAEEHLSSGLEELLNHPYISRTARFMVLLVDYYSDEAQGDDMELFAGWSWN